MQVALAIVRKLEEGGQIGVTSIVVRHPRGEEFVEPNSLLGLQISISSATRRRRSTERNPTKYTECHKRRLQ
jgi:hypothetical protein